MSFKECLLSLGCHSICSSFHLPFLRVDCECNRPSLRVTVFYGASAFNGDLRQWDVAKVITKALSESIRILENDLT
jgi:hypothetical protein